MQRRIGILGGTFNPVHLGHIAAAEEVRKRLSLDLVLFVPSSLPPHKPGEEMPSPLQRLEMARLAVADSRYFGISDIEVKRGGRSYTIDTVLALRSIYPAADQYFITGLDSFLEIETWHEWERLLSSLAFVVLSRPGHRFSDLLRLDFMQSASFELAALDAGTIRSAAVITMGRHIHLEAGFTSTISSTDIRKRVKEGRSLKYLLPDVVEQYIITNKLYA